jgi:hypothetical protein
MKSYEDFTNEDYQRIFEGIAKDTYIFDDIQFNADCVKVDLLKLLEHEEETVSSTAYHMAKTLKLLEYWGIINDKAKQS